MRIVDQAIHRGQPGHAGVPQPDDPATLADDRPDRRKIAGDRRIAVSLVGQRMVAGLAHMEADEPGVAAHPQGFQRAPPGRAIRPIERQLGSAPQGLPFRLHRAAEFGNEQRLPTGEGKEAGKSKPAGGGQGLEPIDPGAIRDHRDKLRPVFQVRAIRDPVLAGQDHDAPPGCKPQVAHPDQVVQICQVADVARPVRPEKKSILRVEAVRLTVGPLVSVAPEVNLPGAGKVAVVVDQVFREKIVGLDLQQRRGDAAGRGLGRRRGNCGSKGRPRHPGAAERGGFREQIGHAANRLAQPEIFGDLRGAVARGSFAVAQASGQTLLVKADGLVEATVPCAQQSVVEEKML